jgi:glycosyltransferase involved in cell wall biosynthesis
MQVLEKLGLRGHPEADLIILDDIFPHLLSSFRIAEFNAYLSTYEKAIVYSTGTAFAVIDERRSFAEVCAEYERRYPEFSGRTFPLRKKTRLRGELIYFMFLQNARVFMNFLTASKLPFVFTLYPGGGFQMHEPSSDKLLRKVCSLPNLRKIITTQKVTHEYVLNFVEPERLAFVYGGVLPSSQLAASEFPRKYYRQHKQTFDICFVAFKYMARGADKGYPVFLEVARKLSRLHDDIRFHVIGPYDEKDINVTDLNGKIKFYGTRQTNFFPEFYSQMDLTLAPTVPFVVLPGAFDGFPPGGCIEAALCGVAVFCTDPLNQNIAFKDGEEIVIVPRDVESICQLIEKYYDDYDALVRLGQRGREAFKAAFGLETQLEKRLKVLSQYLPEQTGPF